MLQYTSKGKIIFCLSCKFIHLGIRSSGCSRYPLSAAKILLRFFIL